MTAPPLQSFVNCKPNKEGFDLFEAIQQETFIKIENANPDFEKIHGLFQQLLQTKQGFKVITKIKNASAGKPPVLIKNGDSCGVDLETHDLKISFAPVYVVVRDRTDVEETKIELLSPMVGLFHELIHVYDLIQEKKELTTDDTQKYPSDYDNYDEYVAIKIGIDGLSENFFREERTLPERVNHRNCMYPPFSEEMAKKTDEYKIAALEAYVKAGASWDSNQIMQYLRPEQIAKSNALEFAVKNERLSFVSKILEAGKEQWTIDTLQMALENAVKIGDEKICQKILEAGKGQWSFATLEKALVNSIITTGKKEIFLQILETVKGQWPIVALKKALENAATIGNKELCQKILEKGKGRWTADSLTLALLSTNTPEKKEIHQQILETKKNIDQPTLFSGLWKLLH